MPHSEDRSWWTDVQHLRPEVRAAAAADVQSPREAAPQAPTAAAPERQEPARRIGPAASEHPVRRRAAAPTKRLTRSDAAGFAAAFDLDGDWGRPQARSMTIVLERTPPALESDDDGWLDERRDGRSPVRPRRAAAPRAAPIAQRQPDRLDALADEIAVAGGRPGGRSASLAVVPNVPQEAAVAPRERLVQAPRPRRLTPRPRLTRVERLTERPDRIAMWAVALGVLLVLIAALSGNAQAAPTARAAPPVASQTVVVSPPAAPAASLAIRR